MHPLSRTFVSLLTLALLLCAAGAQTPRDFAAELTATVVEAPPSITLQWNVAVATVQSQTVLRRLKDAPKWTLIATPAPTATSYTDTAVAPGVSYEYYVYRRLNGSPSSASGYLSSGIRLPPVADRGRVLLLVDDTMSTPLATELATFIRDLQGDGWTVTRSDIARTTATPPGVRSTLQSLYAADPARTTAVILFGRIPVPYSGDFAIDGHRYDHHGAWPTDAYYGDMDGVWTDSIVNDVRASDARNRNVPGDGKFDQTALPGAIELQVGRIDLSNLPAFSISETELLRRTLNRNHDYRHRLGAFASVPQRGLVDDHFGLATGEPFAVTAWRSFTPCVGAGNVAALDWFTTLNTQAYQWAFGCGGGSYSQAGGVGTTADFASTPSLAVFNVLFGSYFGDWDNQNNFLRAPLAGTASSLGLASVWAGRPHWAFHAMAMGETIGYATRATQNNENTTDEGYESGFGAQLNHIALLGDPTLRLYPVTPPASITTAPAAQAVSLSWSTSPDAAIAGYLVSRATGSGGPFVSLHAGLVGGTSFVDRNVPPGTTCTYHVRAVKLEVSPSGSFFNSSQGAFSSAVTAPAVAGPEANSSGLGRNIPSGDLTAQTANGTDFGAVETSSSVTRTYQIENPGTAPLLISGVAISGGNPNDFTMLAPPPGSIAAGTSASFSVRFQPLATGARTAVLTLATNDADEAAYAFAIGGTGLAPSSALAIHPPAIRRSIHAGDSASESLLLSNPGAGPLQHTVSSSLTRYSAIDSDSFGGPAYAWTDISATGTQISSFSGADDGISAAISLGFSFPFYGATFTTVRVCTNGFLSFTDTNTTASNANLPARRTPANMVAPFWADMNIDATSRVYTQTLGGHFIVQYENVSLYNAPTLRVTCQAILKPGGEIVFRYQTVPAGVDYTIGLQNGTNTDGLEIAAHTAYTHDGLAIRIRPPGAESWLSLGAAGGTIGPAGNQTIAATLNATGLAAGNYAAEITIDSNAPATPRVSIPVRLTVGNTPVENWRLARFATTTGTGNAADEANPDGDQHANLIEYAFDTSPTASADVTAPLAGVNPSGYLQIAFQRHTERTDLRYLVEASSDLNAAWTTIASSIHGAPTTRSGARSAAESGAGLLRTVTVEDSAPATSFLRRYLRLRMIRD